MRITAVQLLCFTLVFTFRPAILSAASRSDQIAAAAEAMKPELVATRRDFHQHPELSNREERTSRIVAEKLRALGLEVRTNVAKHGVVALLKGGKPGPVVALRADLRTAGKTPKRAATTTIAAARSAGESGSSDAAIGQLRRRPIQRPAGALDNFPA